MRHLVKGRKLGRTSQHRSATLRALSVALIREHRIVTTLPKAKELRTYFEPLLTRAKEDNSNNRRRLFGKLQDKHAVTKLVDEVAVEAKDRPGGYTRVLKLGPRSGDGAEMAVIELVDYNDIKPEQEQKSKRKRTRRAGRKKKTTPAQPEESQQPEQETAAEESQAEEAGSAEVAAGSDTEAEEETGASESDESKRSTGSAADTAGEEEPADDEQKENNEEDDNK